MLGDVLVNILVCHRQAKVINVFKIDLVINHPTQRSISGVSAAPHRLKFRTSLSSETEVLLLLVRLPLEERGVLGVLLRLFDQFERANFPVLPAPDLCPIHGREDVAGLDDELVGESNREDEGN